MPSESIYTLATPVYFYVTRFGHDRPVDIDNRLGLSQCSLCCLLRGSLRIDAGGRAIEAHGGDLVYFPHRRRYSSHWRDRAECIALYFNFQYRAIARYSTRLLAVDPEPFYFQTLPRTEDYPAFFRRLLADYETPARNLAALSAALGLYSRMSDVMAREDVPPVQDAIETALIYIETHCAEEFSIADVARQCGMSESRLYHCFREVTGTSPIEYKNRERIRRAIELLPDAQLSIEDIAERLNFSSPAYFRRIFKKYAGGQPSDYRHIAPRL